MASVAVKAPKAVSPLIRAGRWSALIVGIVVGGYQHRKHSRVEAEIQEYEKPFREHQAKKAKYEQELMVVETMNELAKSAGIPQRMERPEPVV